MRQINDSDLINMLAWWVQGHEDEVFTGKDVEKEMMSMIRQAPNIPLPYPLGHAHWIRHDGNEKYDECSNCHCAYNLCGWEAYGYYCPHCGAKMDGGRPERG